MAVGLLPGLAVLVMGRFKIYEALVLVEMEYLTLLIVVLLVALSGLFSGLTLGLLGLDKTELERKIKIGNKKALKVYSVRKKGNLLLCTLLLGNVAVNSALAIFLGNIASGLMGGIVATGLIVIFGEIIPQATVSRYALDVGARTAWLVKVFIFVLYPICWPLSKLLDKVLGDEMPTVWSRKELAEIIKHHEDSTESELDSDEERIILGALSFSDKKIMDIITPRSVVFALEIDTPLNARMLNKIKRSGFTRIPIYEKDIDNVIGILYSKHLIGMGKQDTVRRLSKERKLFRITLDKRLDTLLDQFIKKKIHIAVAFNEYNEFVGIVTLEDIVEEILKMEIVDEDDKVVDLQKMAKEKGAKS